MPAKPSSGTAWPAAHGWRSDESHAVIRSRPGGWTRFRNALTGGAPGRTALNGPDLCYIGAGYLPALEMDKALLDIICFPITKLSLQLLDSERLSRLNTAIEAGEVKNFAAIKSTEQLEAALVTRDGRLVYPIRNNIPVLMEEESIDWNQLAE